MPKTYSEKLKDPRWQKKRLEILDSAGWRCEDCGCGLQDGREFHVHHTAYISGKDRKLRRCSAERRGMFCYL